MRIIFIQNSIPVPESQIKVVQAWRSMGAEIQLLFELERNDGSLVERVFNRLGYPLDLGKINVRLNDLANSWKPDLIFIVKGVRIWPETIKKIQKKGVKFVSWSNDDMYVRHGRSRYFIHSAPLYDLIVTHKSYNCDIKELPSFGARKILFSNNVIDPNIVRPVPIITDGAIVDDVLFIGTFEYNRMVDILYLAESGISISVVGWGKGNPKLIHPKIKFFDGHIYGDDFCSSMTNSRISLNFLRRANRDLQTVRSIEIPACKGLMIAERSKEHLNLFKEGEEADFFDSKEELLKKIRLYLSDNHLRDKVADSGYKRVCDSKYFYTELTNRILLELNIS